MPPIAIEEPLNDNLAIVFGNGALSRDILSTVILVHRLIHDPLRLRGLIEHTDRTVGIHRLLLAHF